MSNIALTARQFDGSTPEKSFDYSNPPEGVSQADINLLRMRSAKAMNLLTHVRQSATSLLVVLDGVVPVIETIVANGYDSRDNLPPAPFEGELATLPLSTLSLGLVVAGELQKFMRTEITIQTPAGSVKVVPMTLFRQISK